ncbi:MAG: DNA cytosine methyltransferase [Acidobacteria bacterium]|nr:DNA cytosine methyltransferase [Acidobacteriota bacterium]
MTPLILSLFPGIGLLDLAFEEQGFCVVRGPDLLWGGDIRSFHPPAGRFDGVIGGPPCQAFSRLRYLVEHNGYGVADNLIPEFERCVAEARPTWFLMENVPGAPTPNALWYRVREQLIRDVCVGGETTRTRRFSFGTLDGRALLVDALALHRSDPEPTVCAAGGARPIPVAVGGSGKVKRTLTERHKVTRKGASAMDYKTTAYLADALRLQGLPANFLDGAPFTVAGKIKVVGNGVPLAMGRAVARAVAEAMGYQLDEVAS